MKSILGEANIKYVDFQSDDNSFICSSKNGYFKFSSKDGNQIDRQNTKIDPAFLSRIRMTSSYPGSSILAIVPDRDGNSKQVNIIEIVSHTVFFTLTFTDNITNVQLKRDYIIIGTTKQIHIRKLSDLETDVALFTTNF